MNEVQEKQTFRKKIFYIDPKDGKQKMRIQSWTISPDEDEEAPPWEYIKHVPKTAPEESPQTDPSPDTDDICPAWPETKRKAGRPKGSKNRRGTRVKRKTHDPIKKKLK